MKTLKKLLLTNWHYFSHEIIDFSQINFLTGENGSGKTTIIDALQVIILGETTGHSFNKSASDKSNRTIKGYLSCEIGDNEEGGSLYLRNNRFSSYIVCEFYDDIKEENYVVGIVFDTFEDGEHESKYFTHKGPIPENEYIVDNIPMSQKQLNIYLTNNNFDYKFFNTNTDYRDFIKVNFGNLPNNFFALFKKAIPFSPISDIEKFITEYVCDVDSTIDIEKMQENFRNYKKLEIETNELSKRVDVLKELISRYNDYKDKNDAIQIKKYIMDRSELYLAAHAEDEINDKIDELNGDIAENQELLNKCNVLLDESNKKKERLLEEKFQSDVYKRKAVYEERFNTVTAKIKELKDSINSIKNNLINYIEKWTDALKQSFIDLNDEYSSSVEGLAAKELLNDFSNLKTKCINDEIEEDNLTSIYAKVNDFLAKIKRKQFALLENDNQIKDQIEICNKELEEISEGKKSYDYRLLDFKQSIRMGLKNRYHQDIEVNFLSDLIDIKDESWRLAIETYLNTQRFYLVVDPKYVDDAIKIYDSIKSQMPYFDYGIIDTEKAISNAKDPLPNSLAEEIVSDNKGAIGFTNMLLGALIKCNSIANLRDHSRSITKDGMLYQNYVARSLNTKTTISYIGSKSTLKQKEIKEHELAMLRSDLNQIAIDVSSLGKLTSLEFINSNEIKSISSNYEAAKGIDALQKEADSNKEIMNTMADNFLETLEKSIKEVENEIVGYEKDKEEINLNIIKANVSIDSYRTKDLPNSQLRVNQLKTKISSEYGKEWIGENGEPAFLDLIAQGKEPISLFNSYKINIDQTLNGLSKQWRDICDLRTKYNTQYELNYDAHNPSNEEYEKEYVELGEIKLQEYLEKIKEAKDNAMKTFKNDFLAKLKEKFDTVISQISSLNEALSYAKFGSDSYKFTCDPRKEYKPYYEMIIDPLLLTGTDIDGTEFTEKYADSIENLFRQITFTDGIDTRSELEQNIAKYTDYRSYLKFDLLVTNQTGYTQRLSQTLGRKSGGETQTPFYISVLASFAQAYRLYLNNNVSDSIRLIILDEAFSKMDGLRVEEAVKLLRNFGLQALVSAPTEKAQVISPLVDRTICVVRNNVNAVTRPFLEK